MNISNSQVHECKFNYPILSLTNMQSILSKVDELSIIINIKRTEVLCLTETWLHSDISDSLVYLNGYSILRDDRKDRKGGGTAIYVKDTIQFRELPISFALPANVSCNLIELPDFSMFVMCIYIPPSCNSKELKEINRFICNTMDHLLCDKPNHTFAIAGDFNKFNCSHLCVDIDADDIVLHSTRGTNALDHIIVSKELSTVYYANDVNYDAPISTADHLFITAYPSARSNFLNDDLKTTTTIFDLRDSNIYELSHALESYDWYELLQESDTDKKFQIFRDTMHSLVDKHIPQSQVTMTHTDKEWLTPLTKSLINKRWEAYRTKNWPQYNYLKQKVKDEIYKCKLIWTNKLKQQKNGLWKLFASVTKGKGNSDIFKNLIDECGGVSNALSHISDNFFRSQNFNVQWKSNEIIDDGWSIDIQIDKVIKILKLTPIDKFSGDSKIPSVIYKRLAEPIAYPLTEIFQSAVNTRTYPSSWKNVYITPVPKSTSSKLELTNMRPISQSCLPSKIFEKILVMESKPHFIKLFGNNQHGFRTGCSTSTALITIMDSLHRNFDNRYCYGSVLLTFDLQKAFDKLNHTLIIDKLNSCVFPKGLLMIILDFLSERYASVKLKGKISMPFRVISGAPQGTVLAPYIFSAFFGDYRPFNSDSSYTKYADDLTLVIPIFTKNTQHIQEKINYEINGISKWCEENDLTLNLLKSKAVLCLKNSIDPLALSLPIPLVETLNILGVNIQKDLSWTFHMNSIAKLANQRFYALRKLWSYVSSDELHQLYNCYIRSLLEYGSPVFVGLNKKLASILVKIDKRAHRIIYRDSNRKCNCDIDEITKRRYKASRKLFEKAENEISHILHDLIPRRHVYSGTVCIPYCRTVKARSSFVPFTSALMNMLRPI